MSLTRVTITGADDDVDPKDLVALSAEFAFVEWGILRSWKRAGTPRYPTDRWRSELRIHHRQGMRFAAHLCGEMSREALGGTNTWAGEGSLLDCPIQYQRVQLNGFSAYVLPTLRVARYRALEFILQCSDAEAVQRAARLSVGRYTNVSALFDPSGGKGVSPGVWPAFLPNAIGVGFAGGISQDNIVKAIERLRIREAPFWIDLETGARTDDRFDLAKVRSVLELAAPFVRST